MTIRIPIAVLTISSLLFAGSVLAQGFRWRGGDGWGPQGGYGRMYDVNTVESLAGKVTSVEEIAPREGRGPGVHLALETEAGTIPIHLGPVWYISRQDTEIAAGDMIEVKGSRVTIDDKPAIIAAEIYKNGYVLILRDGDGIPAWSGWRRRR